MADQLDLLTAEEARLALRIDDVAEATELAGYVTTASRLLDSWLGPTVARTITGERHDGCGATLILRHRPVISISSVTEYQGSDAVALTAEAVGTEPDDGYLADPYAPQAGLLSGMIRRRSNGWDYPFEPGRQNIAVTYVAGRVATTEDVDARFKRAAAVVLSNLWRDRQPGATTFGEYDVPAASFPTFAMPRMVRELLAEEVGQHEPYGIA